MSNNPPVPFPVDPTPPTVTIALGLLGALEAAGVSGPDRCAATMLAAAMLARVGGLQLFLSLATEAFRAVERLAPAPPKARA